MSEMLTLLASNAIVATGLAGVGLLADRFLRWPAVRHLVWAAVLLQLLLPPVVSIGVSLPRPSAVSEEIAVDDARERTPGNRAAEAARLASTARSSPRSLAAFFVAVELTGAALFLGLAAIRFRGLVRLLRATRSAPDELHRRARELADKLGLRRLPRVRVTDERVVPMLVALPAPTILLSKPLIDALGNDEIDAILCHELAHARRGDAWLRHAEMLATAFYWWLPTLWLARQRLRRAEEAACDAIVVGANPSMRCVYAESLLKSVELTVPVAASSFVTGSANSRQIKERITMILTSSDNRAPRGTFKLTAALAFLAVLVGPSWLPAQQPDEADDTGSAEPAGRASSELDLRRELIETRLRAYTIEHEIQQLELSHEMQRLAERREHLIAAGNDAEASQTVRALKRLELERAHLDVEMDVRRLETELELRVHTPAPARQVPAREAGDE